MEQQNNFLFVQCPHCQGKVEVIAIACGIFRHGVYKSNMIQMQPHEIKQECDRVKEEGLIYGCGKPFRVIAHESSFVAVICDYI